MTLLRVFFNNGHINATVFEMKLDPYDDLVAPVIVCPPDVTLISTSQVPPPSFSGTVSDNVDPAPLVTHVDDHSEGVNPIVITRTYRAEDASGNTATCTQVFTIHPQRGDFNGDGCIDRVDLDLLLQAVRSRPAALDPAYDFNKDGKVDIADARSLVLHFTNPDGTPCAPVNP